MARSRRCGYPHSPRGGGRIGARLARAQTGRMTERSNTKSTNNLAARAGRWSAQHRKKAIFGWLAFVILAVFIGGSGGPKKLSDEEYGIGEAGRARKSISGPL